MYAISRSIKKCHRDLLEDCRKDASKFVPLLTDLWNSMNDNVFAASSRKVANCNLEGASLTLPQFGHDFPDLAIDGSDIAHRQVRHAL